MFQTRTEQDLTDILKQQLDYFQSILNFSKKFVNQIQTLSINVLAEMMNYRQDLLDKIRELEDKRKIMQNDDATDDVTKYLQKISEVAGNLVEVDNKIYESLQKRKMEYVRQMSENAVGQSNLNKNKKDSEGKSRRFDLYQE